MLTPHLFSSYLQKNNDARWGWERDQLQLESPTSGTVLQPRTEKFWNTDFNVNAELLSQCHIIFVQGSFKKITFCLEKRSSSHSHSTWPFVIGKTLPWQLTYRCASTQNHSVCHNSAKPHQSLSPNVQCWAIHNFLDQWLWTKKCFEQWDWQVSGFHG